MKKALVFLYEDREMKKEMPTEFPDKNNNS